MAMLNGSLTIRGTSSLTSSSKVTLSGAVKINTKSKLTIFWLKLTASSQLKLETSIIQRLNSAAMIGVSSFSTELVKVGKEYFRKAAIEGEAIYITKLEGGGSDYMKINQDIIMTAGDYLEITATVYDEEGKLKDISGCNFHWVMGNTSKSNGNGINIIDPINGEIMIILTPEDTINLYGKYTHHARMVDAHNHPTTIFKGLAKIDK